MALTLQPEGELGGLCLDRRDLFVDALETRRGGLQALRQAVHAAVQIRQSSRQHADALRDLAELVLEADRALAQTVQGLAEIAVLAEQPSLVTGCHAVAKGGHGAQRRAQQLVEFVDVGPELRLQRAESLLPGLGGPDPHLERGALVRRLLEQTVLQRGQIVLHARAHAQLLIVRHAEERATQGDHAEDQRAKPETDTRLAARRWRHRLLGHLRDTRALLPDRLVGEADQAHDVRLELRHARRVAIRPGGRALQLSERGDVLAILHQQARLRGERRTQAVVDGSQP